MTDQRERIEGGLVGMLIGDALGVPYKFLTLSQLPPYSEVEFDPPAGFNRSRPGVPPGT